MKFSTLIRQPSAFFPVVMSFAALALVLGHVATPGYALQVLALQTGAAVAALALVFSLNL